MPVKWRLFSTQFVFFHKKWLVFFFLKWWLFADSGWSFLYFSSSSSWNCLNVYLSPLTGWNHHRCSHVCSWCCSAFPRFRYFGSSTSNKAFNSSLFRSWGSHRNWKGATSWGMESFDSWRMKFLLKCFLKFMYQR